MRPGGGGEGIPVHLGIDIGGTKVAMALGSPDGTLHARDRFTTPGLGSAEADLARIAERARALAASAGIGLDAVGRIGVSVPGPLDAEAGVLLDPPNLVGWGLAPVRAQLEAALGRPVALENDANAAALAEWRFGAGRGAQDLVYLTMSTGVGAGVLVGGRLHRGVRTSAGEVGHMPIEWEGEPCACGMRGCLEAYIGGAAWAARLAETTPPGSAVARLAAADPGPTPEHVVAGAREGDAFALAEMARFNHYLAWGICQLAYVLAPEVVVLGTIPSAAGDRLCLDPVREQVRARLWPFLARALRIEPAGCGDRLGDYAGLAVALDAVAAEPD